MPVTPKADTVYFNGPVLTMESPKPARALATHGGRILAVGDEEDMLALAGPATHRVDLAGRALLPGFIDAHSHFLDTSFRTAWVDVRSFPLGPVTCMDDLVRLLAQRAASTPEGEWIVGWGYDDTALPEGRHPQREDLDRASTRHPIVVQHLTGWVTASNSLALERAGITKDCADGENTVVRRRDDGTPTGVIEAALCPVLARVPKASADEMTRSLAKGAAQYAARGCTTVQEGWMEDPLWMDCARKGTASGLQPLRLVLYPLAQGRDLDACLEIFPPRPSGTLLDAEGRLVAGAFKLSADGSIQALTGWLTRPYHVPPKGQPDYRGYPSNDPDDLRARVSALHAKGLQVAVHCNGDAAIDLALDCVEEAQRAHQRADARHILIHAQTARPDQVERMARLGVIPSFFVAHVFYWGDRHNDLFLGPERARRISPCADAIRAGIPFTLHNDTYVTPIDPLGLVWTAVVRRTSSGRDLGRAEQGIPVYEALRAVTINAARQGFEETVKGSLAPGKFADFVVLDRNPLDVEPEELRDLKVEATLVADKVVFGTL